MAFATANKTSATKESSGILYLIMFELDDQTVYKIGITQKDKLDDRLCEITLSMWKAYRYIPRTYPKRFRKVDNVLAKETMLHKHFDQYRITLDKVSGGTEFFEGIALDELVEKYEAVVNGIDINKKDELDV